jgi:hypothetical protein
MGGLTEPDSMLPIWVPVACMVMTVFTAPNPVPLISTGPTNAVSAPAIGGTPYRTRTAAMETMLSILRMGLTSVWETVIQSKLLLSWLLGTASASIAMEDRDAPQRCPCANAKETRTHARGNPVFD